MPREQKERIKDRMLKTAARLWGYPDAEVESSFDPIVQLLLEACASELEKISGEVDVSHARLVERLAQIMMPEPITSSQPAYGILHAASTEPATVITAEHQFFHTLRNGFNSKDLFFMPLTRHRLFRGQIKYMAIGNKLFETREHWFKEQVLQGALQADTPPNHLWLGLSLEGSPSSLEELSFFFDLRNAHQQEMFYYYLPLARFFLGNTELTVKNGYSDSRDVASEELDSIMQPAFDTNTQYSQQILQRFRHHFLTISKPASPGSQPTTPAALQQVFGQGLTKLQPDIQWIRVEFPEAIRHTLLEDLFCNINCFPVVNKRINEQSQRLNRYLNIMPLHTSDIYFDIKRVHDVSGTDYHVRNFTTTGEMQEGELVVRSSGIGRFDSREAKEIIAYLIEVIRDESSLFEEVRNDYVASRIRELHQLIASLEEQLQPGVNRGNIPYLMIKPREDADYLFIEFYTTNGSIANNIRMGSRLQEYGSVQLQPASITLLSNTQGGKDRLSIDEKVNLYRYHLLSRNRIVTPEDIKALCRYVIGNELREVSVSKGVSVLPGASEGYSRTLDIRLILSKPSSTYAAGNLTYLKDELLSQLTEHSANNYPYRIFMNEVLM
ncbi:type VI secretion system baseplate subunit TssF [Chitinophaga ginsengisoli]|uniref:Type VI secretion system baseplate subunit TssF n=1 Tax=Chitinophaga ginsengisoli TaxID=363837 RepID=A0A2P8G9Y5_9BACT|nr:type VI secretion system baseplate subunit TssF [Chitinophaga ginsengisoli]PSL30781.1 hypothetical protein CLV42_105142 [Chitinophaga ginsengisoli]